MDYTNTVDLQHCNQSGDRREQAMHRTLQGKQGVQVLMQFDAVMEPHRTYSNLNITEIAVLHGVERFVAGV